MDTRTPLAQGIQAAKNGDKTRARDLLYAVVDQNPKSETAWVWLSYVVESVEDRRICLENVLTLSPTNQYARRNLQKINRLNANGQALKIIPAPVQKKTRPLPLILAAAFWAGMGSLFLVTGLIDTYTWVVNLVHSRTFPNYITPHQLWLLTVAVVFLIVGIVIFNVAWALFIGHKIGFFASILLALGLILAGPFSILIARAPNYIRLIVAAAVPTVILFLTLMSQPGFTYEREPAPNAE